MVFEEDEEYKNVNFDKIPSLRAVFKKENGKGVQGVTMKNMAAM